MISVPDVAAMTPEQAWRALVEISSDQLVLSAVMPLLIAKANQRNGAESHDTLLDAEEAAKRVRRSAGRLRRWKDCPFMVIQGRRKLYSSNGIDRWIGEQTG